MQLSGSFLPNHITRSEQGIELSPIFSELVTINLECPMELIQWVEQCSKPPLPCLVAAFWRWANCLNFDTQRSGDVSGGCSCPKDCNLIQSQEPLDVEGGRWHSCLVLMYLLKACWGEGFNGISGNAGCWCGHVAPSAFKVLNQVSVKPIIQSYGNLGFQSCKVGMGRPFWLPKFVMRVKEYQALKNRQ
jgi:hypothetical protein